MAVCSDKIKNLHRASDLVKKAVEGGARIVSLPECFNSPYGTQFFAQYAECVPNGETFVHLKELAIKHKIYLVGGSIPEKEDEQFFNTSLVFDPKGNMIAKHRKVHLFDIDIPGKITFKESDVLSPGNTMTTFEVDGYCVGLGICYDMRFPELAHLMREKGARILLYPGAFNMTTGPIYFELLTRMRAVDNQVYCASIAPATDHSGSYVSWGHSCISAPSGEILTSAGHDEDIIYCDMDKEVLDGIRSSIPTWQQKRNDLYQVLEHK